MYTYSLQVIFCEDSLLDVVYTAVTVIGKARSPRDVIDFSIKVDLKPNVAKHCDKKTPDRKG